jgi:hypothetical protein
MEIQLDIRDDDLRKFEAAGAAPLPVPKDQDCIEHDGARIWYSKLGTLSSYQRSFRPN